MGENQQNIDRDIGRFDILQILKELWGRVWLILAAAIVGAAIFFTYAWYFVAPIYEASIVFYVNNSNELPSNVYSTSKVSPSDINAAKSLVETYIVILKTNETYDEISEAMGEKYSPQRVAAMIDAEALNETEVFKVTVRGNSTEDIYKMTELIGEILPRRISDIVDGSDVRVVNHARLNENRVYPSYSRTTGIGFAVGLLLAVAFIVIRDLLNNTVRNEEYLQQMYTVPVLTVVPEITRSRRGGYGYGYYKKAKGESGNDAKKTAE